VIAGEELKRPAQFGVLNFLRLGQEVVNKIFVLDCFNLNDLIKGSPDAPAAVRRAMLGARASRPHSLRSKLNSFFALRAHCG
jgi:hypothetical protein